MNFRDPGARAMSYAQRLAEVIEAHAPDPGLADLSAEAEDRYDAESDGYDIANTPRLYFSPQRVARMLARQLADPDPDLAVLDLACGTGLTGAALAELGYRNLTGADISSQMLDAARAKGIYRRLEQVDLHGPLPFAPEGFAGIACAGSFYEGLVQARALGRMLPLLQPKGWLACDINTGAWLRGGFAPLLVALQDGGLIDQLRIETGRFFARAYLEPDADFSELEGRYVLARRSA